MLVWRRLLHFYNILLDFFVNGKPIGIKICKNEDNCVVHAWNMCSPEINLYLRCYEGIYTDLSQHSCNQGRSTVNNASTKIKKSQFLLRTSLFTSTTGDSSTLSSIENNPSRCLCDKSILEATQMEVTRTQRRLQTPFQIAPWRSWSATSFTMDRNNPRTTDLSRKSIQC